MFRQFNTLHLGPHPPDDLLNDVADLSAAYAPAVRIARFPSRVGRSPRAVRALPPADPRHLEIHLRELGLAVLPAVLVAEALRELVVALDRARRDQQLFGLLGRLREGVEQRPLRVPLPAVARCREAGGYEELAGAFRRGAQEDGGLDLCEAWPCVVRLSPLEWGRALTFFVEDRPDSLCYVATPLDVLRQGRAAKIEIAVLQAHLLVRLWHPLVMRSRAGTAACVQLPACAYHVTFVEGVEGQRRVGRVEQGCGFDHDLQASTGALHQHTLDQHGPWT